MLLLRGCWSKQNFVQAATQDYMYPTLWQKLFQAHEWIDQSDPDLMHKTVQTWLVLVGDFMDLRFSV